MTIKRASACGFFQIETSAQLSFDQKRRSQKVLSRNDKAWLVWGNSEWANTSKVGAMIDRYVYEGHTRLSMPVKTTQESQGTKAVIKSDVINEFPRRLQADTATILNVPIV